jgi:hypothetical protein
MAIFVPITLGEIVMQTMAIPSVQPIIPPSLMPMQQQRGGAVALLPAGEAPTIHVIEAELCRP